MLTKSFRLTAALVAIAVLLAAVKAEAQPRRRASRAAQDEDSPLRPDRSAPPGLAQAVLFVDPATGSDRQSGTQQQPFQTITQALSVAQPNTVIRLASGDYSQTTGETFPLQLRPGIAIQGPGGQPATIRGGGEFESPTRSRQNAAILAADQSRLARVAVVNPEGHGVWIETGSPTIVESTLMGSLHTGIYVASGSPTVQNSYFSQNGTAGLVIFGNSQARVERNTFEATGVGITVAAGAMPEIVENRIVGNENGLVLLGNAQPALSNNEIAGNRWNGTLAELPFELAETKTTAIDDRPQPSQSAAPSLPTVMITAPSTPRWSEPPAAAMQVADRPRPRILQDRGPDLAEPEDLESPSRVEPPTPRPTSSSGRLQVPPSQIPMGSGGGLNYALPSSSGRSGPPPPPTRASTLGLHYKVFVEARGERAQAQVRAIVPDAFRARFQGEDLMQVGAFPDEDEAEARSQLLLDNGFEAWVEYMP